MRTRGTVLDDGFIRGTAELKRMAYQEFKVTQQVSTGNGEAFLAQSEDPPAGFVRVELGYGVDQRPCGDCHKPCTLDYTLNNLREINRRNVIEADALDPTLIGDKVREEVGVKRPTPPLAMVQGAKRSKHRRSPEKDRRLVRANLRQAGVRVVAGQYVDERPRTWVPNDPNAAGRRGLQRRKVKNAEGKVVGVKLVDLRANKLIREHRKAKKQATAA